MRDIALRLLNRKNILFFAWALLCSIQSFSQSDPSHSFLNITTVPDDEEQAEQPIAQQPQEPQADTARRSPVADHRVYKSVFLDIGSSDLTINIRGNSEYAYGSTWAFGGQIGYRIRSAYNYKRMFLCAGLEIRNFRSSFTLTDPSLGIYHDNIRFWYAGIPLMFQYVNTRHTPGNDNDINCYFQAGVTLGYRAAMSFSREDGSETIEDNPKNYSDVLVQPFVSAGISYTTQRKVCLIGPYVAYSSNNISSLNGVTANFVSYGVRLSALLFR